MKPLFFAEGNRAPYPQWFRVMRHDSPTLYAGPRHTARTLCKYPCPHDQIAVDFLPTYAEAFWIARAANIQGTLDLRPKMKLLVA